MLSDGQIERYARQIVLPEVGGRGQAGLLVSRANVLGDGAASRHAADLLGRAGVQVSHDTPSIVIDLRVDAPFPAAMGATPLVVGRLHETRATVVTLPAGFESARLDGGDVEAFADRALHACALRALGALAASEALVLLLDGRRSARRTTIDVAHGWFTSGTLEGSA